MRFKLTFALLTVALLVVGPVMADQLLCPNTANNDAGQVGGVFTTVSGANGSCGDNSAVTMYIPTDTDYARLEWTGTGLTIGSLSGANASVAFTAGSGAAGAGPYYMLTFQDSADATALGLTNSSDQVLMLEFQPNTVTGGNSMVLDASATLFNLYDNTAGVYLNQGSGGQQDVQTLNYWLSKYPGLADISIDGFRIGEGLAGGCGAGQNCSESLTVYSVDVSNGAVPEPTTMALVGGMLLGLAAIGKKRFHRQA